jgi:8-amino-7-oxononanoate synthase
MNNWSDWLRAEDAARGQTALERSIAVTDDAPHPWATRDGRRMLNLSSNNYLGLAEHPALLEAAARGAARGAGAGSSRLVAGSDAAYRALEENLAAFKGTERALVFGSGYLANVGTLTSLLDRSCGVVSDSLNHASIIDGARLSRATVYRYRHADINDLEAQLRAASAAGHERVLIVTDSVFSMDGDVAPLADIIALKHAHGAALMIDEAHGTGVFGPNGAGYSHDLGVDEHVDIQLGTFSKAFGAYGGYVAASDSWIRQLVNTSRTLTYSTGLPPALIETIAVALELVAASHPQRAALRLKADRFRATLQAAQLDTGLSSTQIIPLLVGGSDRTLQLAERLRARGLLAHAIRPPTVAEGTARIRFSLLASHSDESLADAAGAIIEETQALD